MREYGDNANIAKSRSLSIQGGAFGIVLAVISMVSVRIGPIEAALTLVPLITIFMWPRGSSSGLSSLFIFAIGLLVDISSGGPAGLWAFIYLTLYGVLRPNLRAGESSLALLWPQFLVWLAAAFVLALIIGRLFIDGRTSVSALASQIGLAALLFPLVYLVRQGLRHLVNDPNEPGYSQ